MLDVLTYTAPVFIIIGLGSLAVWLKVIPRAELRVFANFVMYFALPALVFHALSQRPASEVLNVSYLLAYGAASIILFSGALFFTLVIRKKPLAFSTLFGLGMCMSNSGFVGYPIAILVLGPPAAVAMALNMMIENIIILPIAIGLCESTLGTDRRPHVLVLGGLKRVVRNPIIIAIVLGCIFSLGGFALPSPFERAVEMIAGAAGAVALFFVGGILVGLDLKGNLSNMAQVVTGKLVLHPLFAFIAVSLVPGLSPEMKTAAVLFASVPMMSIYPILGQRYGAEAMTAGAMMSATVVSFITTGIVLWLLQTFPFAGM